MPLLFGDVARVLAVLFAACLAVGILEYALSLFLSSVHDIAVIPAIRLLFICAALAMVLWTILAVPAAMLALAARLALAVHDPAHARRWPGLLAPRPSGFTPAAAWLWALAIGALFYLATSSYATLRAITWFKEPQLTALLLANGQLILIALCGAIVYILAGLFVRAGRRIDGAGSAADAGPTARTMAMLSPLGRLIPAAVLLALLAIAASFTATALMPQLAPLVPWRALIATAAFVLTLGWAVRIRGRRGYLWARAPRAAALRALGAAALFVLTALFIGADREAKAVAIEGSPVLGRLLDITRYSSDFDGDEYGFLFGENDCAPFNGDIFPLARDIPDNGIDEDCNGRDFSLRAIEQARAQAGNQTSAARTTMPVPADFRQHWNFLLLTVDTLRYDHTGFGGYLEAQNRDTTPNLDRLVERAFSFDDTSAPSAGTMASMPAILTSKFFHSGLALDENVKPRTPPRLKPENLLISEILKAEGYYNGAILTHVYFEDWGMEQGFDTYDNELGKTLAPRKVTSHDVTDKALDWIRRNRQQKWFLWAHYLDPHGRYVAHPGEPSFGTTEKDLYDGEIRYTDKHLGRLFDELARMPGSERTIIMITSDHGDGFNEHGFINHGMALYREMLHVPMIVYIPGLPGRRVPGAASPLDLVPTIADLAGAPYDPQDFEGVSLIPQLFYGKDDLDRVVFAETDWPRPQRAAISRDYKLIYRLKGNLYELYDLKADPWEKRNVANRDKDGFALMQGHLDDWLERVYYDRNHNTNQQLTKQLGGILLTEVPEPQVPLQNIRFDDGRIEVVGFDSKEDVHHPGDRVDLFVYFRAHDRPSDDFSMQIHAWPLTPDGEDANGQTQAPTKTGTKTETIRARASATSKRVNVIRPAQSRLVLTAGGVFPSSRWRADEYIRDRFVVTIPKSWPPEGGKVRIALAIKSKKNGHWLVPDVADDGEVLSVRASGPVFGDVGDQPVAVFLALDR